jgi:hypothetical protein
MLKRVNFAKDCRKKLQKHFDEEKMKRIKNLLTKFKKHSYIRNKAAKSDVMCPFCVGCHVRLNVHQKISITKSTKIFWLLY